MTGRKRQRDGRSGTKTVKDKPANRSAFKKHREQYQMKKRKKDYRVFLKI
jgi:hypothetical protein